MTTSQYMALHHSIIPITRLAPDKLELYIGVRKQRRLPPSEKYQCQGQGLMRKNGSQCNNMDKFCALPHGLALRPSLNDQTVAQ
jgi:hypothetical protein